MLFLEQFNFILKIFYLFGLKPSSSTISATNTKRLFDLITVVTTSTLCVASTVYLIFFPHFSSYGIIFVLIYYGSLLPSLLMILTANGQSYFNKTSYQTIIYQITKLEKQLEEKSLKHSLECIAFRYKIKIAILYMLFLLSQVLVFVEVWYLDSDRTHSSFLISLIRSTYPMQLLHFVLYSDIAAMFFNQLNEKIQYSSMIFVQTSGKIEFLKYVKLVHLDLWKLIVGVNNFFGRNLLFTSMFWFINITHQLYWIFLNMHDKFNAMEVCEGLSSLSFAMAAVMILVSTCESCLFEVKSLIANIEQYTFWTDNDVQLHQLKLEILNQILHLPINISACGFFTIDRRFLTSIVASCCMYIIIFIQFHQSVEKT